MVPRDRGGSPSLALKGGPQIFKTGGVRGGRLVLVLHSINLIKVDCSVYFSELKVYKAELAAAGQMFVIYIGKVEYYPLKIPKARHR